MFSFSENSFEVVLPSLLVRIMSYWDHACFSSLILVSGSESAFLLDTFHVIFLLACVRCIYIW